MFQQGENDQHNGMNEEFTNRTENHINGPGIRPPKRVMGAVSVFQQGKKLMQEESDRGKMIRFALFLGLYVLGRFFVLLFNKTDAGLSILNPLYNLISLFITHSSCYTLALFFPDIQTNSSHVIFIHHKAILILVAPCSGLDQMLKLSFILLFYPLRFYKKLYLWPLSMVIVLLASTIHFILLIFTAWYYMDWFNVAHNWITKIVFYGFYFLCWLIWENSRSFKGRKKTAFPSSSQDK